MTTQWWISEVTTPIRSRMQMAFVAFLILNTHSKESGLRRKCQQVQQFARNPTEWKIKFGTLPWWPPVSFEFSSKPNLLHIKGCLKFKSELNQYYMSSNYICSLAFAKGSGSFLHFDLREGKVIRYIEYQITCVCVHVRGVKMRQWFFSRKLLGGIIGNPRHRWCEDVDDHYHPRQSPTINEVTMVLRLETGN